MRKGIWRKKEDKEKRKGKERREKEKRTREKMREKRRKVKVYGRRKYYKKQDDIFMTCLLIPFSPLLLLLPPLFSLSSLFYHLIFIFFPSLSSFLSLPQNI